jgi:hypothetical protein
LEGRDVIKENSWMSGTVDIFFNSAASNLIYVFFVVESSNNWRINFSDKNVKRVSQIISPEIKNGKPIDCTIWFDDDTKGRVERGGR